MVKKLRINESSNKKLTDFIDHSTITTNQSDFIDAINKEIEQFLTNYSINYQHNGEMYSFEISKGQYVTIEIYGNAIIDMYVYKTDSMEEQVGHAEFELSLEWNRYFQCIISIKGYINNEKFTDFVFDLGGIGCLVADALMACSY